MSDLTESRRSRCSGSGEAREQNRASRAIDVRAQAFDLLIGGAWCVIAEPGFLRALPRSIQVLLCVTEKDERK